MPEAAQHKTPRAGPLEACAAAVPTVLKWTAYHVLPRADKDSDTYTPKRTPFDAFPIPLILSFSVFAPRW